MIFSQLGSYFGRPGRQGVDGNLTGLFFIDAPGLPGARGRICGITVVLCLDGSV